MRAILTALSIGFVAVALVNFATFFVGSVRLGGDALNGYERDGRFYVGSHGTYAEVAEAEWRRSRFQASSVLVTHLLGMAGMGYLLFARVFPRSLRRGSDAVIDARVRQIEGSGAPLATTRCAGRIGGLHFRGPLLRVALHPAGLVIRPIWMQPLALALGEIAAVRFERVSFRRGLIIAHTSPHLPRIVALYCGEDDPLATNLRTLMPRA